MAGGRSLARELAVMKPLPPTRLSEYDEVNCPVVRSSTIRVKKVGYSVPARLIGQEVKVEVHESELKTLQRAGVVVDACRGAAGIGAWCWIIGT